MLQTRRRYNIGTIKDEVRALVGKGALGKKTQLFTLSRHFDDQSWKEVEHLLTVNEYLLRDCVCDLIGKESWVND
ncbi:MAG: DUF4327 family protein [Cyanobacteria bacterium P01_D01_bin.36]